jgi:hypothetical protein
MLNSPGYVLLLAGSVVHSFGDVYSALAVNIQPWPYIFRFMCVIVGVYSPGPVLLLAGAVLHSSSPEHVYLDVCVVVGGGVYSPGSVQLLPGSFLHFSVHRG